MKKVLAFNGGMRKSGNTTLLLQNFLDGARKNTECVEELNANEMNLEYCRGCTRCNLVGRCTIHGDEWGEVSQKISKALRAKDYPYRFMSVPDGFVIVAQMEQYNQDGSIALAIQNRTHGYQRNFLLGQLH